MTRWHSPVRFLQPPNQNASSTLLQNRDWGFSVIKALPQMLFSVVQCLFCFAPNSNSPVICTPTIALEAFVEYPGGLEDGTESLLNISAGPELLPLGSFSPPLWSLSLFLLRTQHLRNTPLCRFQCSQEKVKTWKRLFYLSIIVTLAKIRPHLTSN